MMDSMIPYSESEEVDWTPPVPCEVGFYSSILEPVKRLSWHCLCGWRLVVTKPRNQIRCSCGRTWGADFVDNSVLLTVGQNGYLRER